jgi:hypothetical protein
MGGREIGRLVNQGTCFVKRAEGMSHYLRHLENAAPIGSLYEMNSSSL